MFKKVILALALVAGVMWFSLATLTVFGTYLLNDKAAISKAEKATFDSLDLDKDAPESDGRTFTLEFEEEDIAATPTSIAENLSWNSQTWEVTRTVLQSSFLW